MLFDAVVLVGAFLTILLGAELFTNGIEWFGKKLDLAEGAVGSVLAAVGTALPETMIPLIAILITGGAAANEVGIGAILGAPFMLSTLAMFVTGIAVLGVARRRPKGDEMLVDTTGADPRRADLRPRLRAGRRARRSCRPSSSGRAGSWPVVLIGMYVWYVRDHLQGERRSGDDDLAPLRLHRLDRRAPDHPVRRRGCGS